MASIVGARELAGDLEAVLARVRGGETVTVTQADQPIALLVPDARPLAEVWLRTRVEGGRVDRSGGKLLGKADPRQAEGIAVSEAVVEDRR
jgi:antitoxin (DNA-binding transcriptional repressor) of toxin-antitoxin stability system